MKASLDLDQGAGDQGLMFGAYACNETPSLMPFPIYYAHRLMQRQAEVRRDGKVPWLRPDAKSQLSVHYVDGKPVSIDTVVVSTQHSPDVSHAQIEEAVIEEIIRPFCLKTWSLPKRAISSIRRGVLWLVVHTVIAGSRGAKSLSIATAAQRATAAALSPAGALKSRPFGQLMPRVMWQKTLSRQAWQIVAKCKCLCHWCCATRLFNGRNLWHG